MDATKKVPKEIEDMDEAQIKELKKNHKALRLLTGRLGDSNKRKVLSSLTAKEKWDALEKIHAGRSSAPSNLADISCYNCQEMRHFTSSYTKSKMDQDSYKDQRKQRALVSAAWRESESDEKADNRRSTTLVTSLDTQVRPYPKKLSS